MAAPMPSRRWSQRIPSDLASTVGQPRIGEDAATEKPQADLPHQQGEHVAQVLDAEVPSGSGQVHDCDVVQDQTGHGVHQFVMRF